MAQSPVPIDYKLTRAGGGGALRTLFWQAPTSLNPHFAVGAKDAEGAGIFYEPVAAWEPNGNLVPLLAAEIPDLENGGLAADGMSVTWKLKKGVQWHDGQPFTADDVVFNWEYASDPATAATTIGSYQDVEVEKLDSFTVRVRFEKPTPFWAGRANGLIHPQTPLPVIQRRQFARGASKPQTSGNRPYRFVEFEPGDLVKGKRNPAYHVPKEPLQKASAGYGDMIRLGERWCRRGWGNEAADTGDSGV